METRTARRVATPSTPGVATLVAIALALLFPSALSAEEFEGILEPEFTPGFGATLVMCARVPAAPGRLPIPNGAALFEGRTWAPDHDLKVRVLLVEPARGGRQLMFVDTNGDGSLEASERVEFGRGRHRGARAQARVFLPAPSGMPYRRIPVDFFLPNRETAARLPSAMDQRPLLHSVGALVTARVRIDRRTWRFRYGLQQHGVDLRGGYQAVDEGRLGESYLSPWVGVGNGAPLVFRIGSRYVSTKEIDLARGRVVIETRAAADYRRLELRLGLVIPEFSFQDISGRTRRLSDFRGGYVLLNFWYPGCGPCLDEFPYLKEAERRLGPRGLTIIGLSQTGSAGEVRVFTQASGQTWIEAAPWSVRALINDWFRIVATPTPILLDRNGQVIVLDDRPDFRRLRGPRLLQTLERIIPSPRGQARRE